MSLELSWIVIGSGLFALLCLIFAVRCFKMPSNFKKNQEEREEIKKKLKHAKIEN